MHFWGIAEQQTRNNPQALQAVAPHFQGCFRTAVLPPAAALVQQLLLQQQPGQQPGNQQQLQPQVSQQQMLLVLSAAALIGGWWQPAAQPDGGASQQLALQALQQCLGQGLADAVAALVRCAPGLPVRETASTALMHCLV